MIKLLQRHGLRCQNVVAQSKIRVVSTSISEFEITWLQDVIKILLQRCSNIAVTVSVGFLGCFSMDYSVLFAVVETWKSYKSRIRHTSSHFKRTLHLCTKVHIQTYLKYININLFTMNKTIHFFYINRSTEVIHLWGPPRGERLLKFGNFSKWLRISLGRETFFSSCVAFSDIFWDAN